MGTHATWDPWKALTDERKHGVSFREAESAFADPFALAIDDERHSRDEDRWLLLGLSARGRLLVVVHVDAGHTVRIISARKATSAERRIYEEA